MKKTGWMIGLAFLLVLFPLTAQAATESEYYEQGVALFGQGNYEDALKSFEEAARLNPEDRFIMTGKAPACIIWLHLMKHCWHLTRH